MASLCKCGKKKAERVKDKDLLTRGSSDGTVGRSCSIILWNSSLFKFVHYRKPWKSLQSLLFKFVHYCKPWKSLQSSLFKFVHYCKPSKSLQSLLFKFVHYCKPSKSLQSLLFKFVHYCKPSKSLQRMMAWYEAFIHFRNSRSSVTCQSNFF